MPSFAHMSDVHLGAFRHSTLKNLVLDSFRKAIDLCVERKVDFIVISGDLFDSNLPDLSVVKQAVAILRKAREKGINIYVIYGSHDFSPTQTSMIDIIEETGLIRKVTYGEMVGEKLRLRFVVDDKTGAKITGISRRKAGVERKFFEILDRESLEREGGFKIFAFHAAIDEYRPVSIAETESMPVSLLPKNFNYYAGGHIHEKLVASMPGYEHVVFPGTLFGANYTDLEKSAKGERRGFYVVNFSDRVESVEFVEVKACDFEIVEYDAGDRTAQEVQDELMGIAKDIDVEGKLVLFKVWGELSSGRTADVNFARIREIIEGKGALHVMMNYHGLTSKEYTRIRVAGETREEIERKLFRESIGSVNVSIPKLKGDAGVALSLNLLRVLKQGKKDSETKADYEKRILRDAVETLGIKEVPK